MQRPAIPLIARLRRRLVASAWLFAFLMLAKSVLATGCLTDGLDVAPASMGISMAAAGHDSPLSVDDGDAFCAHAGTAGSHCACAHGVALPLAGGVMDLTAAPSSLAVFDRARFASSPQKTVLRPPIS